MKTLFWITLLLASSVCLSQIIIQGVPLEGIEDDLDELMEEGDGAEVVIYYEEDYDDDDDDFYDDPPVSIEYDDSSESSESSESMESSESVESSEENYDRRQGRKMNWRSRQRWAVNKIRQFMRRHNVSDIDYVPGRTFGQGLRRVHNWNDEEDMPRGKAAKVYRKVIRVVEKKLARRDGAMFSRICERLPNRDEPRRRIQEALPTRVRQLFIDMFDNRMEQLRECCDLEGDDELQEECFNDAYIAKMDDLCTIQLQMEGETLDSRSMFIQKLGERQECCQILEPSARAECFKEGGRRARQARRSRQRRDAEADEEDDGDLTNWRNLNPQQKVDKVCQRIVEHGDDIIAKRANNRRGNAGTWKQQNLEERFEAMQECCSLTGMQRLECADNLKRQKLRELCDEPTARIQGYRGREKQEVREACCSLEGAEQEECFDEAIHEHIMQKRERKMERRQDRDEEERPNRRIAKERRQERKQARKEARQEARQGGQEERQGMRQAIRKEHRQERRQQRRVRVEIEEEVEIDEERTRRSIDMVDRRENRERRRNHGRRRGGNRQESEGNFDRQAHREMMEECCTQGRTFGETIEVPNDGLARKMLGEMCYEKAREISADIHDEDIDPKCLWSYKRCCYTSHFEMAVGDRQRRGRKQHGRRRRVRVEIEEDLDEDAGDDAIEGMIEMAEVMVVDGQI